MTYFIKGKRVAITGAGGSIGSALAAYLCSNVTDNLLLLDNSEMALYRLWCIFEELGSVSIRFADVRDMRRIAGLFREYKPHVVFHCAAMKHVPLCERDEDEARKTNVDGTQNVIIASEGIDSDIMMLISTDKAADPLCALGRTKHEAELKIKVAPIFSDVCKFASVRFHNVIGSSGSVVGRFAAQVAKGGPVTVTHPDMERWFSTPDDVCRLLVKCAEHAAGPKGRDLYALEVGNPVKIVDLAKAAIGDRDIEIKFTGPRSGEKLRETLIGKDERIVYVGGDGLLGIERIKGGRSAEDRGRSAQRDTEGQISEAETARADV